MYRMYMAPLRNTCVYPGITTFVMQTALPVAEEVVARHERIRLSARDGRRVLDLLENPPKPTAALRAAAKRFRRHLA